MKVILKQFGNDNAECYYAGMRSASHKKGKGVILRCWDEALVFDLQILNIPTQRKEYRVETEPALPVGVWEPVPVSFKLMQ